MDILWLEKHVFVYDWVGVFFGLDSRGGGTWLESVFVSVKYGQVRGESV